MDGHLVDDVLEADRAARLREDREGVRVPLDEDLGLLDLLAVLDLEVRAVDDRVPLADDALVVHDVDRPAAVHDDQRLDAVLLAAFDVLEAVELDRALVPRLERRLILHARCRAADVERAHRQLRARLTNRLRGHDADGQAEFDQTSGRQIAAVAPGAHAAARRAGQDGADLHPLDARVFHRVGKRLVHFARRRHDHFAGRRIHDVLERHAADDAVAETFDDLAARVDDRARVEAVERAAVVLGDDHVLRHVDEAAREVSGVGRLQRRIREALARAMRRDEVLEHVSPSRKFARIGCSMISPDGFAMRPRMPASWRICCLDPRAPESAMT